MHRSAPIYCAPIYHIRWDFKIIIRDHHFLLWRTAECVSTLYLARVKNYQYFIWKHFCTIYHVIIVNKKKNCAILRNARYKNDRCFPTLPSNCKSQLLLWRSQFMAPDDRDTSVLTCNTSSLGASCSLSPSIFTLTTPDLSTMSWMLRPFLPITFAETNKQRNLFNEKI